MSATLYLLIPLTIGFLGSLLLMPIWIRKAHQIRLVWKDMNKYNRPLVAGSGGVIVTGAFVMAVLFFVAYRVFYLHSTLYLVEILSLLLTISLLGGIGLIDDLLGWQRGGLSRRSRIVLVLLAALPLIVINAGRAGIELPFLGAIDLGLIYPLLLIPLGVVGATTTFNFLAGFNGLEAGQGILLIGGLSIVAYFTGNSWLAFLGLCMIASLFAFLFFNITPASIFPGDSMTYPIGGMIAIMAILGNFEKVAVFFFIPIIIEVLLKTRGFYLKQSFGKPQSDGSLSLLYPSLYGLTHVAIYAQQKMGLKPTEKRSVYIIWAFQAAIIALGLVIFREGIFYVQ